MFKVNCKARTNLIPHPEWIPSKERPRNPIHVVAAMVPVYREKADSTPVGLLCIRRNLPGFGFGGLAFAGGYQDLGELLSQAAARELDEEVGLKLNPTDFFFFGERLHNAERQLSFFCYAGLDRVTIADVEACEYDPSEVSEVAIMTTSADTLVFSHHHDMAVKFFNDDY